MDDDDDLRWECLGPCSDWPTGSARVHRLGARRIAVVHNASGWFAFKNGCPHRGLPLVPDTGSCASTPNEGGHFSCPHHGWSFDMASGAGPEDSCLRTYPLRIRDGEVFIGL